MNVKKFFLSAALALAVASAAVAAPLDAFKGMSGKMDIAGGTAHIPVMKEAAKRIMSVNPEIRITVAGGGSGVGVQQVGWSPSATRAVRSRRRKSPSTA